MKPDNLSNLPKRSLTNESKKLNGENISNINTNN